MMTMVPTLSKCCRDILRRSSPQANISASSPPSSLALSTRATAGIVSTGKGGNPYSYSYSYSYYNHKQQVQQGRCYYSSNAFPANSVTSRIRLLSSSSSPPPKTQNGEKNEPSTTSESIEEEDNGNGNDNDNDIVDKFNDGIDSYTRKLLQNRHRGIIMNENGLSHRVLPGGYIVKTNNKTGEKKMVEMQRTMGYFWDLKDLRDTDEKPVVSNSELIPVDQAQVFPPLNGDLISLSEHANTNNNNIEGDTGGSNDSGKYDNTISLPSFITKNNRSKDPTAECTLIAIHHNEYGNQMIPSWTEPFEDAFSKDTNRIKVIWLSLNEGRVLRMLRYFIVNTSKKKVPEYRKENYLMHFGNTEEYADFSDVLRMHNKKTAYVYLLDGLGRVRFAGSGRATEEDVEQIISFTKKMAPGLKADKKGR